MKLVMAIFKPFERDEIRPALSPIGAQGLTVDTVTGIRTARPASTPPERGIARCLRSHS